MIYDPGKHTSAGGTHGASADPLLTLKNCQLFTKKLMAQTACLGGRNRGKMSFLPSMHLHNKASCARQDAVISV